jgi:hypothetical protein
MEALGEARSNFGVSDTMESEKRIMQRIMQGSTSSALVHAAGGGAGQVEGGGAAALAGPSAASAIEQLKGMHAAQFSPEMRLFTRVAPSFNFESLKSQVYHKEKDVQDHRHRCATVVTPNADVKLIGGALSLVQGPDVYENYTDKPFVQLSKEYTRFCAAWGEDVNTGRCDYDLDTSGRSLLAKGDEGLDELISNITRGSGCEPCRTPEALEKLISEQEGLKEGPFQKTNETLVITPPKSVEGVGITFTNSLKGINNAIDLWRNLEAERQTNTFLYGEHQLGVSVYDERSGLYMDTSIDALVRLLQEAKRKGFTDSGQYYTEVYKDEETPLEAFLRSKLGELYCAVAVVQERRETLVPNTSYVRGFTSSIMDLEINSGGILTGNVVTKKNITNYDGLNINISYEVKTQEGNWERVPFYDGCGSFPLIPKGFSEFQLVIEKGDKALLGNLMLKIEIGDRKSTVYNFNSGKLKIELSSIEITSELSKTVADSGQKYLLQDLSDLQKIMVTQYKKVEGGAAQAAAGGAFPPAGSGVKEDDMFDPSAFGQGAWRGLDQLGSTGTLPVFRSLAAVNSSATRVGGVVGQDAVGPAALDNTEELGAFELGVKAWYVDTGDSEGTVESLKGLLYKKAFKEMENKGRAQDSLSVYKENLGSMGQEIPPLPVGAKIPLRIPGLDSEVMATFKKNHGYGASSSWHNRMKCDVCSKKAWDVDVKGYGFLQTAEKAGGVVSVVLNNGREQPAAGQVDVCPLCTRDICTLNSRSLVDPAVHAQVKQAVEQYNVYKEGGVAAVAAATPSAPPMLAAGGAAAAAAATPSAPPILAAAGAGVSSGRSQDEQLREILKEIKPSEIPLYYRDTLTDSEVARLKKVLGFKPDERISLSFIPEAENFVYIGTKDFGFCKSYLEYVDGNKWTLSKFSRDNSHLHPEQVRNYHNEINKALHVLVS